MTKKLFTLLIVAMLLTTISVLVLSLTGHEDLVRTAFGWIASSVTSVVETLGAVGIVILVLLLV